MNNKSYKKAEEPRKAVPAKSGSRKLSLPQKPEPGTIGDMLEQFRLLHEKGIRLSIKI